VYIMTRTESSAIKAIDSIKNSTPASTSHPGHLNFIHLDLANLSTIPASAAAFCARESRLDVLFNNAGVACVPLYCKTPQGLEPHIGINCVGSFLLTKLLLPVLTSTAAQAPENSVRIVWTSSVLMDLLALKGGILAEQLTHPNSDVDAHYVASKAGNLFLASEHHRCFQNTGILSIT
jgi:NAD(P)-dependent dehydrogenase (short-subunit alcohol dehydrogenase family)